ncbi:polysaccharide deacetylase family protein [Saccharicrinis sp. FJH62]|uniref:polysaccharide deacetylase family protein n=1 Tax=Saccharicrinis sp. FJH62 TaxID=3344657 RepID=UPI0035D4E86C
MFLYTEHITSRHSFVARLFSDRLGIPFKWVDDPEYLNSEASVIAYASEPIKNKLVIFNSGFLDEECLRDELPEFKDGIFSAKGEFLLESDLFSAVFYVVSRYEEYYNTGTDTHGRFKPENSILYKLGLIHRPVVDEWIFSFGKILSDEFGLEINPPSYRFQPTFDVDVAFAYLGRPFWLTLAGYARDLTRRNFNLFRERFRVNTGLDKDPYDTYAEIKKVCNDAAVKPFFFFQLGVRNTYDKNLYPLLPLMKNLISDTDEWAEVGLHPSYHSNSDPESLTYEFELFEKILKRKPVATRQHYLKLTFPGTFQKLAEKGIEQEYSLGYAHVTGFRAGTCHPFPFFDLTTNTETALILKPFMVMDGTLKDHMKLDVEAAKLHVNNLVEAVKENHGEFIFIWHNSSLDRPGDWHNWKEVLKHIFKVAAL